MHISRMLYYKTSKQFLDRLVFLNSKILAIRKMNHRNTMFIRAQFVTLKHQKQPKYPKWHWLNYLPTWTTIQY